MIKCRVCNQKAERAKRQGNICKPCWNKKQKEYRDSNKGKIRVIRDRAYRKHRDSPEWVENEKERGRDYWASLRHDAIMAYGGYRCECCGETEPLFLSIDHINNDGAEHRRSLGYKEGNGKGAAIYSWLKRNKYPEGFQILCMNCNHGKARNGGTCPHKQTVQENCVNSGELQTGQSRAKPEREGVTTIERTRRRGSK